MTGKRLPLFVSEVIRIIVENFNGKKSHEGTIGTNSETYHDAMFQVLPINPHHMTVVLFLNYM